MERRRRGRRLVCDFLEGRRYILSWREGVDKIWQVANGRMHLSLSSECHVL